MAEASNNLFGKTDHLYSVEPNMILVKKNILTGKIHAVGTITKESRKMEDPTKTVTVMRKLKDLDDDKLNFAYNRYQGTPKGDMLKREIDYRNLPEPRRERTDAEKNAEMKVKEPDQKEYFRRRIKAKTGMRFRWPWETVVMLPTENLDIDTAPVMIDTIEHIKIGLDTDYKYSIIDPEKYAALFNSYAELDNVDPHKKLLSIVSNDLDTMVRDYIMSMPSDVDKILRMKSADLLNIFADELFKISTEYGIEVTKFHIKNINLPEEITKATADKLGSIERAKGRKAEIEAEASKEALIYKNKINELKEQFPNMTDQQILVELRKIIEAETLTTKVAVPDLRSGQQPATPVTPVVTQAQPDKPVSGAGRPANAPEWFDDYVNTLYDETGLIYKDVWDDFVAAYSQNSNNPVPARIPKVTIMNEELFAELCRTMGINPPVVGHQHTL